MLMTRAPKFKPTDRVRIRSMGRSSKAWTVLREDTNRTPVHDHEPAYQLFNGKILRYAYESDLEEA